MEYIKQLNGCKIIQTKKTIEWLVSNTEVRTFNKVTITGYQRQISKNHVKKIVTYILNRIENNMFFLPTSIICASENEYSKNERLFIVDGQHRVEAFKYLYENEVEQYKKIKDFELSVVVLEKPEESLEVDTFITINKTSKKVDTSLAYILKSKLSKMANVDGGISRLTKQEYLAVELIMSLNEKENSIWYKKVLLEGNPSKHTYETISLNSFVRSLRVLIGALEKNKLIELEWADENELNITLERLEEFYRSFNKLIVRKWPGLFVDNAKDSVIQGSIGVSSLNKLIILILNKESENITSLEQFCTKLGRFMIRISSVESDWYSGNEFSKYSSESGYSMIANMLFNSAI